MSKLKPKEKPHYVNNRDFSEAVYDYAKEALSARTDETPLPIVSDYIATCFMKIAEGLSHRPNFVRYTYREEMVMDAVENCLRAIGNYNIEASTRTGKPNAFSYFTQICYFAFIRRITKERKQQDIKFRYIEKCGIEDFIAMGMDGEGAEQSAQYVDTLRNRIDQVRSKDAKIKEFAKEEKLKAKDKLELFMV
jgi:hypothetical protein